MIHTWFCGFRAAAEGNVCPRCPECKRDMRMLVGREDVEKREEIEEWRVSIFADFGLKFEN
jgi:hypothetical protein